MRLAVLSLWTGTPEFKLTRGLALLFSASVAYAVDSFDDTELVTDILGLEIADRLGWDLKSFNLALEDFCPDHARHVWMLGKLRAQEIQTQPFCHLDLDILMFRRLPVRLTVAEVMVQSKDHPKSYHDPFVREIIDHLKLNPYSVPYNTGLIGWNDLDFMREYCKRAMSLALSAAKIFGHGGCVSIVCEQLLLGEMARVRRKRIECAIPLPKNGCEADMKDVNFAHFWGRSKINAEWMEKVEQRFALDFPQAYKRFVAGWKAMEAGCHFHYYPYSSSGESQPILHSHL